VIEDGDVLMDMQNVAFHLIAMDAVDRLPGRNGRQRCEPDGCSGKRCENLLHVPAPRSARASS